MDSRQGGASSSFEPGGLDPILYGRPCPPAFRGARCSRRLFATGTTTRFAGRIWFRSRLHHGCSGLRTVIWGVFDMPSEVSERFLILKFRRKNSVTLSWCHQGTSKGTFVFFTLKFRQRYQGGDTPLA